MRELARIPCAVLFLLACAALFPAIPVHAQAVPDLQDLRFHPVPLAVVASEENCNCAAPAGGELVDMALFEEVAADSYLQDIASIRDAAGSYAPELTERFTSAAILYQQQARHEEALGILDQAIASSRIHAGLYSPEQVFLAERSIESLVALRRFDAAEDRYAQVLDIQRKLYGPAAAQTAHAQLGLGTIQLERLLHELAQPETGTQPRVHEAVGAAGGFENHDGRFATLYSAQAQFVDALRILIEAEAWQDPALLKLEKHLVRTYYIDAERARVIEHRLVLARDDASPHARMRSRSNRMELPEQYRKGEQAYLRMADHLKKNPNATLTAVADVLLGRADWNLLFGRPVQAEAQYRQLGELMALAGAEPTEAAALLQPRVPVTLPTFVESALASGDASDAANALGHVDVSFSVDHLGHARTFEVLATSSTANAAVVAHLGNLVRNALFRPPVAAHSEFRLRYYYFY